MWWLIGGVTLLVVGFVSFLIWYVWSESYPPDLEDSDQQMKGYTTCLSRQIQHPESLQCS